MTVDRYTKTVLTIIAVCLVWLSLGGSSLLPRVEAQGNPVTLVPRTVYAGEDVGFRLEGMRRGVVRVGRIVVNINGQWVPAELATVDTTFIRPPEK